MSFPKMTLKVTLLKNNNVDIELLQVSNIYTKPVDINGNTIITKHEWMFYVGDSFNIYSYNKMCILPSYKNYGIHRCRQYFKTDKERQSTLKGFHDSLLDWSGNKYFKDKKIFKSKPEIRFNDNIWIIF